MRMREIKFRGKRFVGGVWEIGWYLQREGNYGETLHFIYDGEHEHLVHPETIGQYTEREKMFEGDIVRYDTTWNKTIGVVRFGDYEQDGSGGEYSGAWVKGFYVERVLIIPSEWDIEMNEPPTEREEEKTISIITCDFEVIGNRWDHPHLLKGEEG